VTDRTPYGHCFPISTIHHTVWLYPRFPFSYRDVKELPKERGIEASHDTLRV